MLYSLPRLPETRNFVLFVVWHVLHDTAQTPNQRVGGAV